MLDQAKEYQSNALTAAQMIEILSSLPPDAIPRIETWESGIDMFFQRGITSIDKTGMMLRSGILDAYCEECHPDAEGHDKSPPSV